MVGFGGGADCGDLRVEEEVRAAVDWIKAERTRRFLRHLVETAERGHSEKLNERTLGVEFFGRPAQWDPQADELVRNEAGRARKQLARYYETDGAEAEIRVRLPPDSYVPLIARRGDASFESQGPDEPDLHAWWYVAAGVLMVSTFFVGWLYWHLFRTAR